MPIKDSKTWISPNQYKKTIKAIKLRNNQDDECLSNNLHNCRFGKGYLANQKNVLNPQNHSLNILNTVQTILLSTQTLCKELEVYLENYFEIVASSAKFIAYVYIYTL